ncbi:MAG: zinc ribbon domain-containing protein [Planctomycetota bacterium]|nr:zinc ribbon domain-containing protein [Planctomycetota bacterium]
MPTYVYRCDRNGAAVEVIHSMDEALETWGELCDRAGCEQGDTPADAPVYRQIFAPAGQAVRGAAELKNLGFKKLVRRDKGVYENVTATDKEARYYDANDPSTRPHLPKELD